jgi:hypothetical protein
MAKYDLNATTLAALLDDPEVVAIMERHSPGITTNPMIGMAKGMTGTQVMGMAGGVIGTDKAQAIQRDIAAL